MISPADGSTVDTLRPTLVWDAGDSPGADYGHLRMDSESWYGVFYNSAWTGGTCVQEDWWDYNLHPGATYYWKTRLEFPEGPGTWSEEWEFTTAETGFIPDAPVLIEPADGSVVENEWDPDWPGVSCRWSEVTGAAATVFMYGTNPDNWERIATLDCDQHCTGGIIDAWYLEDGRTYYWWVKAVSDYAAGPASEVWSFTYRYVPSPVPTATPSVSPTPPATPTASATPSAAPSLTPTPSVTPTPSITSTPSITPTPSLIPTPSLTPTPVPLPDGIFYCLPAGGTRLGGADFETYILVFNPGEEETPVEVRFTAEDGEIALVETVVAARSRLTVRMRDYVEEDGAFSTIVTSLDGVPLAVERAMYWTESEGQLAAGPWTGGHAASGTTAALQWHLAEGATHVFDQFVHVLNPDNLEAADVEVTFVDRHGASWNFERLVPPQSNWKIDVFAEIGSRDQVSARVVSRNGVPVAVDRTMYWPKGGPWADGHASAGAPAAALTWRLAEGATHLFDCYLAIYNPSETETAEILIGFTGELPGIIFHPAEVGPLSRYTLKVNDVVGEAGAVSATVVSDIPVTAERAMYWPQGSPEGWTGGHGSLGTPQAFSTWRLAEGAAHLFDCYLLIFNPSDEAAAAVEITFLDKEGDSITHQETVAPLSRVTVKVNDLVGGLEAFSVTVESDTPVVVERAMYWPLGGPWNGGHSSLGVGE